MNFTRQLHSDNGIPNQNAPTEERDTDARIVSLMQFSWMRRCDSAVHVKIKIAVEVLILMLLSNIVNHRLTMCENDKLFN